MSGDSKMPIAEELGDRGSRDQMMLEVKDFERSFARMLENMALASVMRNSSGQIAFINTYLLELTGYKREEVMGRDFVELFIPPELREKTRNTFKLVADGILKELTPYLEGEILGKDGTRILIGWNNTLMKDADGNFKGISSIGENLSAKTITVVCENGGSSCPDESCVLLRNYEKTDEQVSGNNMIGEIVLVKVLKSLGGDKGHVQLAVNKTTKQKVAVKSLRKDLMKPEEIERARREIEIMQQLNHLNNPYIIKLLDAEETENHFNLVIDYVSGGELVSLILENKGLKEAHTHKLFKQLVCAISCCHENSIVHRDIKLQNILLDEEGNIKLIDFGLSNFVEAGRFRNTFCGTPAYAPPEILLGTQYKGPEVDVWSLGVVLYSMLTSVFPFTTIAEILRGKFKEPAEVSEECLDLLKRMLDVKKETRITLPEIMAHPWVLKVFPQEGDTIAKRKSVEDLDLDTKRQKSSTSVVTTVEQQTA